MTKLSSAQASYVPEHDKIVHAPSTSANSEGGDSISTGSQPRRLAVPQGGGAATYGSVVGFKVAGQKMQIHAFLGTNPVIKVGETDLEWKTVGVAFSGGAGAVRATADALHADDGVGPLAARYRALFYGADGNKRVLYEFGGPPWCNTLRLIHLAFSAASRWTRSSARLRSSSFTALCSGGERERARCRWPGGAPGCGARVCRDASPSSEAGTTGD